VVTESTLSPHPGPLPRGEGESIHGLGKSERSDFSRTLGMSRSTRLLFPLPKGEGQGEGNEVPKIHDGGFDDEL